MNAGRNWGANFGGAGMRQYEDSLVGPLFIPWGEHLLDLVGAAPGEVILDVACGPGSVSRLAASRVGQSGAVTGCDLSPAMLKIASDKPAVEGAPVTYLECSADALAVDDSAYDVVVCQQGFQFFPDRAAALAEMRRAARSGGRLGISVWCEIERCPPFAAVAAALEEALGIEAAASYRGGPWGFPDAEDLSREVAAAGFGDVRVVTETLPTVFDGGVDQLVQSIGVSPVGPVVAALDPAGMAAFRESVARAVAPMVDGDAIRTETCSNTALAIA